MRWTYQQSTGLLENADRSMVATGYSGHGEGKNNPAMQDRHNIGPIPQGLYRVGNLQQTAQHGPDVRALDPHPENRMFGRGGFMVHGDSIVNPGEASEGCIIMPKSIRVSWLAAGDVIEVVA
jgi:hypothetical protein